MSVPVHLVKDWPLPAVWHMWENTSIMRPTGIFINVILSINCAMFYSTNLDVRRVYCVVGDGEAAEGSIWESLHFASHYKLDNLCVIFDVNRLGQSEPTSLQHQVMYYKVLILYVN